MTARVAGSQAQVTAARDALSHAALLPRSRGAWPPPREPRRCREPRHDARRDRGPGGLEVRATVEPAVAVALRPGAKLRAVVDGQSDPITATVTAVAPAGDATTNRFEVKASLPPIAGLRAGLFARLLVSGQPGDPQITVPSSALFARGGLTGVFVVSEGRARLRWVAPGARAGDLVEIRAGVEAGEHVVLDPTGLVDGARIKEQRAGGPGAATQHPLDESK